MPVARIRILAATMALSTLAACGVETVSRSTVLSSSNDPVRATPAALRTNANQSMKIYLTGYSFWDNTPPGSAAIAKPVIHRRAGGTGTFRDPITMAVGHSKAGGRSRMDYPAGTRFYLPRMQKYAIVEDVCGDGPRPQTGPCHIGYRGLPWLDIYVGGRKASVAESNRCMYSITGVQDVIINPHPNHPVRAGEIVTSHCRGV